MKKTITTIAATAFLAAAPLTLSASNAEAGSKTWKHFGKGVATGVGVGVGLGIVNSLTRPREPDVVYVQPAPTPQPVIVQGGFSQAHYNYCFAKYRSYHAASNTYQPYHGGRRPCYSPY